MTAHFLLSHLVGASAWSRHAREHIAGLATTNENVLIAGPAGSGKKFLAALLHAARGRKQRPLVKVACHALSGLLGETQLFGHASGGSPFARGASLGCLRVADGGTLLLVGVDQLDLDMQVKLRSALTERLVTPLGPAGAVGRSAPVDVQLIATSQNDLAFGVSAGTFDAELYRLLSGATLETVALDDRKEDMSLLAEHFLASASGPSPSGKRLTPCALAWMQCYPWPGNISQLKQMIEAAHCLPSPEIDFAALKSLGRRRRREATPGYVPHKRFSGFAALRAGERDACRRAPQFARRCNRHAA